MFLSPLLFSFLSFLFLSLSSLLGEEDEPLTQLLYRIVLPAALPINLVVVSNIFAALEPEAK
jgi:hypothetical protein